MKYLVTIEVEKTINGFTCEMRDQITFYDDVDYQNKEWLERSKEDLKARLGKVLTNARMVTITLMKGGHSGTCMDGSRLIKIGYDGRDTEIRFLSGNCYNENNTNVKMTVAKRELLRLMDMGYNMMVGSK